MSGPVSTGRSAASHSPRDGEVVATVPDSTPDEVAAAVAAARAAADAIASVPPVQRARWLDALADALEADSPELVRLADAETALGVERLRGEVARMAQQLRFYGSVAAEGSYLGVTIDHETPTSPRLVRVNRPLGPVAVFGASNFPFAFGALGNDTASALAAGCPVVIKAHPAHLATCVRIAEIATGALAAAGAPEGALGMVFGLEAGVELVKAPGIRAVGFTGSEAAGMMLWRIANARDEVIPVYAEMGTVNPVIVTRAAAEHMGRLAASFVQSLTLGNGQFCTKPGLLLVPAGHDAARLVGQALVEAAPVPTMLTAGIAAAVARGEEELTAAGATVVSRVAGPGVGWSADAVVLSAPATALAAGSRILEECFGPVGVVVEYADQDELAACVRRLQGSLVGSVMTGGETDPDAEAAVSLLAAQTGRVTVGDWPTGVAWTWAQQHGGPWPATSNPAATSVGAAALDRFVRPVAFQSVPDHALPSGVRECVGATNPWSVPRRTNGRLGLA